MIDWITSRIKWRYVLLIIVILLLGFIYYQYSECKKSGKKMGGTYKCPLFSKNPVSIVPVDEYYDKRLGECYHYIDYGDNMSIRKVPLHYCD